GRGAEDDVRRLGRARPEAGDPDQRADGQEHAPGGDQDPTVHRVGATVGSHVHRPTSAGCDPGAGSASGGGYSDRSTMAGGGGRSSTEPAPTRRTETRASDTSAPA